MTQVMSIAELRSTYVTSKLLSDPEESSAEGLEKEFNRAILRYLHLTMKNLQEHVDGLAVLIPALNNEFAFLSGFVGGAKDEFEELSVSSNPELREYENA